jgi:hypothetical protein
MNLYHGSNVAVECPNLKLSRENLDFGIGFYTTVNMEQVIDFVHENRRGIYAGKMYDLVIGPVANDDVFATLIVYEQGILNVEQTLEALKVKKLYSQFVFKTEKALSLLKFLNSFEPGAEQ